VNSQHPDAAISWERTLLPPLHRNQTRQDHSPPLQGPALLPFEEIRGKTIDFVEVFTVGEYHAIDVRFQDKTALHFVIDPGFIMETELADWKTGNWRPIKRWPLIHSETHRIKR